MSGAQAVEYDGTAYESDTTCAEAIDQLVLYIEAVGWSQCGRGDLFDAMKHSVMSLLPFDQRCEIRDYIREACGRYEIGAWHSSPQRTEDEVLNMLDDARTLALDPVVA